MKEPRCAVHRDCRAELCAKAQALAAVSIHVLHRTLCALLERHIQSFGLLFSLRILTCFRMNISRLSLHFFFFLFSIILLLFNYSCLHFLPTPAKPTSLPCFHLPPWFCPCVLYSSSWKPFSLLSLHPSPLAIVRLFLNSMSLVCIFSKMKTQESFVNYYYLVSPYFMPTNVLFFLSIVQYSF